MRELLAALILAASSFTIHHHQHTVVADIKRVFGRHYRTALCVTNAENRKQDPKVISKWGDVGLFQVNPRYHPQFSVRYLQTVKGNIRAAWVVSDHGTDWWPWTGTYAKGYCHGLG